MLAGAARGRPGAGTPRSLLSLCRCHGSQRRRRGGGRRLMLFRGLAAAAAVVIIDQISKAAVLNYFAGSPLGAHETVTPFFNLVLTYNRGMSFGLFNTPGAVNVLVFSLLAAAIVIMLILWLRRVE